MERKYIILPISIESKKGHFGIKRKLEAMKIALFCVASFLFIGSLLLNAFYLRNLFFNIQKIEVTASCHDCEDEIKAAFQKCKGAKDPDQCTIDHVSEKCRDCLCEILDIDCPKFQDITWNLFMYDTEKTNLKRKGT